MPQIFDLVEQIGDVELVQPALPKQPDLLFDPLAVIAFVERLTLLVDRVRTRHGAASRIAGLKL
jgi:hypothetical protein